MGVRAWLDRRFEITLSGSSINREVVAGLTTFFASCFILAVQAELLGNKQSMNINSKDAVIVCAVTSAVATLVSGLWINVPFAIVPAMGVNAYIAEDVSDSGRASNQALAAVFIQGIVLCLLSSSGVLRTINSRIPIYLRSAAVAGLGIYLARVGLESCKFITGGAKLVEPLTGGQTWLFVGGFFVLLVATVLRIKTAILLSFILTTAISWNTGLSPLPDEVGHIPVTIDSVGKLNFTNWTSSTAVGLVTLIYTDIIVQPTVIAALYHIPELKTTPSIINAFDSHDEQERGGMPRTAWRLWFITGAATTLSAILGGTSMVAVMESAAGIKAGGRTGLTAITISFMFVLAIFFSPIFASIPGEATASALVLVGALLMGQVTRVNWSNLDEAIPSFITLTVVPLTSDVAVGVIAGFTAFIVTQVTIWFRSRFSQRDPVSCNSNTADAPPLNIISSSNLKVQDILMINESSI